MRIMQRHISKSQIKFLNRIQTISPYPNLRNSSSKQPNNKEAEILKLIPSYSLQPNSNLIELTNNSINKSKYEINNLILKMNNQNIEEIANILDNISNKNSMIGDIAQCVCHMRGISKEVYEEAYSSHQLVNSFFTALNGSEDLQRYLSALLDKNIGKKLEYIRVIQSLRYDSSVLVYGDSVYNNTVQIADLSIQLQVLQSLYISEKNALKFKLVFEGYEIFSLPQDLQSELFRYKSSSKYPGNPKLDISCSTRLRFDIPLHLVNKLLNVQSSSIREKAMNSLHQIQHNLLEIYKNIVKIGRERSELFGYHNIAEYTCRYSFFPWQGGEYLSHFLEAILNILPLYIGGRMYDIYEDIFAQINIPKPLQLADFSYICNKLQGLLPTISLQDVWRGIGEIIIKKSFNLDYDLTYIEEDFLIYNIYAPDKKVQKVLLGKIYIDLNGGSNSVYPLISKQSDNSPAVCLISLNLLQFPNCEVTIKDLSTILHEFGHAMGIIQDEQKYQILSASRLPFDIQEVHSIFMQNFAPFFFQGYNCSVIPENIFRIIEVLEFTQLILHVVFDMKIGLGGSNINEDYIINQVTKLYTRCNRSLRYSTHGVTKNHIGECILPDAIISTLGEYLLENRIPDKGDFGCQDYMERNIKEHSSFFLFEEWHIIKPIEYAMYSISQLIANNLWNKYLLVENSSKHNYLNNIYKRLEHQI